MEHRPACRGPDAGQDAAAAESRQLGHAGGDERRAPVRRGRAGRGRAAEPPGGRDAVGALDETGQEKQGSSTAGVKRQYLGCAGRVANGINTVHLSYVRERHRARADRRPAVDPPRAHHRSGAVAGHRAAAGPGFRTKGQLAIDICADAYADGHRFDFVCGDEVYGSSTQLREFLEADGQAYVLRVASSFTVTVAAGRSSPAPRR